MDKILTIGSCRVKNPTLAYRGTRDKSVKLYMLNQNIHTLEQIIQAIEIMKQIKSSHTDVVDIRATGKKFQCFKLKGYIKGETWQTIDISNIDKYIIEISGVTNYVCRHGYFLNPFPKFYKHKKYKKVYSDNYLEKIKKIHQLLNNKPVLFVSNHNIMNKPSRTKLIQALSEYTCNNLKSDFFNPTNLIDAKNIKKYLLNENHYTPIMILKVALEIFSRIKRGYKI